MESSYQTISKMPMSTTIANIISSTSKSSFHSSTSASSLHNSSNNTNSGNGSSSHGHNHSHHSHNHHHSPQPSHHHHNNTATNTTTTTTATSSHQHQHRHSSSHSPHNRSYSGSLSINLSQKGLTAEQLLHLSSNFPLQSNITTLKLGFNDFQDEGAFVISSLLQKNRSITCLDIGFCNIGDKGIESISNALAYNQTLKILYLSGNLATSEGFKHLGNALGINKTLQALYLTGNAGRSEGIKYLSKGLKFNYSLNKLFLNGNKIECDGASSISDLLLTNHTIKSLNLSDNDIGDTGLISLSEAMANHRDLQELELSFNKISPIGMVPFIDSLIGYHSLQRLLLDNNKIQDNGAKSLALALPHMRLVELNVGFNDIGIEGLLSIIGAITNSKNLQILVLSGNTIDNTVAKALANFLMMNTSSLQSIYVDRTNLTSIGERFIATGLASNRNSTLKTLTGFELGKVLHLLGSPSIVCEMSNEQALKYLNQMWKTVEKSKNQQQQQTVSGGERGSVSAVSNNNSPSPHSNQTSSVQSQYHAVMKRVATISPAPVPEDAMSAIDAVREKRPVLPIYKEQLPADKAAIVIGAKKLREMAFNNADLWGLYQYFYSPVATMSEEDSSVVASSPRESTSTSGKTSPRKPSQHDHRTEKSSNDRHTIHERPELDDSTRPIKKQVNKFTVSRISNYNKIKTLLEEYKSNFNEEKSLLIMRQLKYLEDSLPGQDVSELEKLFFDEVLDY